MKDTFQKTQHDPKNHGARWGSYKVYNFTPREVYDKDAAGVRNRLIAIKYRHKLWLERKGREKSND